MIRGYPSKAVRKAQRLKIKTSVKVVGSGSKLGNKLRKLERAAVLAERTAIAEAVRLAKLAKKERE